MGLVAATSAGAATTCLGGAVTFTKPDGEYYQPSSPTVYKTTSRCADINLRLNTGKSVKVCFYKSDYTLNYCQSNYTQVPWDNWTVVASDVNDGTLFRFRYLSDLSSTNAKAAF
ncbi:hypothetical protein OG828_48825 [Streptomyces sp. NBC_00457]|uniref:hypothetical protein n=1 Tax=Streptomyces sp. NBC_00457 TaxID=2975748 RepID=UPI002E226E79